MKESGHGQLGNAGKEREYEGILGGWRGKSKYKPGFQYFLGTTFREQYMHCRRFCWKHYTNRTLEKSEKAERNK